MSNDFRSDFDFMNFTNSDIISCSPADSTPIWIIVGALLFVVITALAVYYGKRFYYNSAISPNTYIYNVVARYRSQPSYKKVDRKVYDGDARIDVFENWKI